ncbi:hypothetical protein SAMN05446934_9557 [Paraburkholderia hospita]|jgi:hypothetical protein|nr:hypothetical protein SAMN06266956_0366 [Paraburkholderia hospita]SKD05199.1 hypothetical protein SAMN05446934_9557 [Paraburkholderia hospita]SKD05269.1 hypothetical protein SAMN05445504_9438 [Burkholderia sp. CF099]
MAMSTPALQFFLKLAAQSHDTSRASASSGFVLFINP